MHQNLIAFLRLAFLLADVGQPVASHKQRGGFGQLGYTEADITYQRGGGSPVDADILSGQVKPDQVGLRRNERRLPVIETEIHARTYRQYGVRALKSFAARGAEEQGMRWRQAATPRAVEIHRRVEAFGQQAQLFGGSAPPHGCPSH